MPKVVHLAYYIVVDITHRHPSLEMMMMIHMYMYITTTGDDQQLELKNNRLQTFSAARDFLASVEVSSSGPIDLTELMLEK